MPIAELLNDRVEVDTDYRDRELVKLVPGARWDNDARTWWAPLSWATCAQLRGVFGSELRVGAGLNEWARAEIADRIQPCLALRTAEDCTDPWILTRMQQLGFYDAES